MSREVVDWKNLEQKFEELIALLSYPVLNQKIIAEHTKAWSKEGGLQLITKNLTTYGGVAATGEENRNRHRENVELALEAIIEVAISESTTLFNEGNYKITIAGSKTAIKFIKKVYGNNSIQQIEPLFLLAKSYQYTKKFNKAMEFLSISHWIMIKSPDCPLHVRAELHQNFGLLFVSMNQMSKAVDHLSSCVYYLSLLHGTDSLITSFGYFNLGNVFASKNDPQTAQKFFGKVIDIWHNQLTRQILDTPSAPAPTATGTNKSKKDTEIEDLETEAKNSIFPSTLVQLDTLDEEKIREAQKMFDQIGMSSQEQMGENSLEYGKTLLVIGLYQWWIGEIIRAKESIEKAHEILKSNNQVLAKQCASILDEMTA